MRPLVMGILNVTPDSFSDGGRFDTVDAAIAHARSMVDDGADIVDVGGESTRPGAAPVGVDEELERVLPIVGSVSPFRRVSIDTRNEPVARAAVEAGATMINDVSASLGSVAAELGVGFVAMHMKGRPDTMQEAPHYDDVVAEVRDFCVQRAVAAVDAGCTEVWIDPGFGFGKTEPHNLELLTRLDEITDAGFGVVVGTSRKRWIGSMHTRSDQRISVAPTPPVGVHDRLEGSVATATYAMAMGATMIRVHDVKAGRQAASVVAGRTTPAGSTASGGRYGKR